MVEGMFCPSSLRMKKSTEDQGLESSETLAMTGLKRSACGSREAGSGGGEGTSS